MSLRKKVSLIVLAVLITVTPVLSGHLIHQARSQSATSTIIITTGEQDPPHTSLPS